MVRNVKTWLLLAALLPAGAGISAHETTPRTPNVRVDNTVSVTDKITVTQKQTYRNEFVEAVWNVVDENKDGKLSAAERKAFAEKGKAFYTDYTTLRLNWAVVPATSVAVNLDNWPSKKPKAADAALSMTLTAVYAAPLAGQQLHLVDLVIPNINAHEITCKFELGAAKDPLLASGPFPQMTQIDGHPDTFSLVFAQNLRPPQ